MVLFVSTFSKATPAVLSLSGSRHKVLLTHTEQTHPEPVLRMCGCAWVWAIRDSNSGYAPFLRMPSPLWVQLELWVTSVIIKPLDYPGLSWQSCCPRAEHYIYGDRVHPKYGPCCLQVFSMSDHLPNLDRTARIIWAKQCSLFLLSPSKNTLAHQDLMLHSWCLYFSFPTHIFLLSK